MTTGLTTTPSLFGFSLNSSLGKLWDEFGIHFLILVSCGIQVFLFFAAGLRRRSASHILRSLLWLAYLSADSVAIFVLGHLMVHANGPRHQLLFFWAPFVLFHLGGQDTMTAFSMQDNELWMRHLLGFVTQVAIAGYVVSRTCWADRRLLAAMVLVFLSGCFKYVERTLCLYKASRSNFRESLLDSLGKCLDMKYSIDNKISSEWKHRLAEMLNADGRRHSTQTFAQASSTAIALVEDSPINDTASIEASRDSIRHKLKKLKSNKDRCRVYIYVSTRLVHIYERLYTKAPFRFSYINGLEFMGEFCVICYCCCCCYFTFGTLFLVFVFLVSALLLFFPIFSISTALVLFEFVQKDKLYRRADVIVSYILLTGAIILEVASLFVSILSYVSKFRSARKQWSEMLVQYNMIESITKQDDAACIMTLVPQWIVKHLDDKTSHVPISDHLKKFVLDKLLDFGTREEDWNFASFRGQLALRNWIGSHEDSVFARPGSSLQKNINDVDFSSSVLIRHIATDILYFQEDTSINTDQQMKEMSRELSNYIMYLVFKCGVMLTSGTELLHNKAHAEIAKIVSTHYNLGEKEAIKMVYQANKEGHPSPSGHGQPIAAGQPMESKLQTLISSLLPRACDVAQELINIHREGDCWNLIASVWVEMLYNIAPR